MALSGRSPHFVLLRKSEAHVVLRSQKLRYSIISSTHGNTVTMIPDRRRYSLSSHGCRERYSDGVSYRGREIFI